MPDINNENEITLFAETNFRGQPKKFGIKLDDRRRHIYVIGKTGMGKTNLLENLIYSDIIKGHGCCYVDPHGDTAEKLLDFIPPHRINDVIYFNPADIDYPLSFNVLEKVDPQVRHLVASGLIGVFKKLWADSWGPRLEYILRHCILALLDYPGSTMLGINRMLIDKVYRKKVLSKVTDPVVKTFWIDEYPKWSERVLQEVISPIQNKVGQFLSTSLLRNIVGQVSSSIDLRKVMDEKKILILNLSKGKIGEDAMQLLGSMIITKIQLAAMSRVDIPEKDRKDFFLYVDELQNFVTESFANILSEARKYRLNLTVAHQYIEQLGEVVGPAVFGNVGTIVCFRVGAADAEFLTKEFAPTFDETDLVNLPKYNIYLKLMIDGVSSDPFSATCLPPLGQHEGHADKIITVSRERYSKKRDVVEEKIARWSGVMGDEEDIKEKEKEFVHHPKPEFKPRQEYRKPVTQQPYRRDERPGERFSQEQERPAIRQDRPPQRQERFEQRKERTTQRTERPAPRNEAAIPQKPSYSEEARPEAPSGPDKFRPYEAKCDKCGITTYVSFKPDGKRDVFCKDCLKEFKKLKKEEMDKLQKIKEALLRGENVPGVDRVEDEKTVSLSEIMEKKPVEINERIMPTQSDRKPSLPALSKEPSSRSIKKVGASNIPKSLNRPPDVPPLPGKTGPEESSRIDAGQAKASRPDALQAKPDVPRIPVLPRKKEENKMIEAKKEAPKISPPPPARVSAPEIPRPPAKNEDQKGGVMKQGEAVKFD